MFGDEAVTREILGNVPGWLVPAFYVLAGAACLGSLIGFQRRWKRYRESLRPRSPEPRPGWQDRLRRAVRYLAFHEQLRRDPYAGWSHLLVVYGFLILFVGTCLVFLEHDTPLHFFYGWFYQAASLVVDLGGLAFLIGLAMFLARRATDRSPRILRAWWVTALSAILLAIGVTGFLLEAARIAVDLPAHEWCSVVGYPLALGLRRLGVSGLAAVRVQQWLWAAHAGICVAFFALLPWGFFSHMVFGLASVASNKGRPLSRLPVLPVGPDRPPGATTWRDFAPLDLLQADACTTCGRCNEVCPATASGKPLRPRDVILELRRHPANGTERETPSSLALADDVLWSCTTCAACNQACPVDIDVYGKIVELRRGRVESGEIPAAAERVFESVTARHNPFGKPDADRMHWARELDVPVARPNEPVEVLYWIGCAGSFSPEGQAVARAMIRILNHLQVNYRVLGTAERCTGDPARRMGEEGLFRECAAANLDRFRAHGVRRVLTHCPHCYNTIRNEYPALAAGGSSPAWQTQHHSQFLAEQIAAGRLPATGRLSGTVTFHDPCYLGRGNGVVAEPRAVLGGLQLPVVEMPRHGSESFCCGAGGGSMWLDVRGRERIENQRYQEATATGASVVGTGCPFCKTMLEAARPAGSADGAALRVMDLAELVAAAEGL